MSTKIEIKFSSMEIGSSDPIQLDVSGDVVEKDKIATVLLLAYRAIAKDFIKDCTKESPVPFAAMCHKATLDSIDLTADTMNSLSKNKTN